MTRWLFSMMLALIIIGIVNFLVHNWAIGSFILLVAMFYFFLYQRAKARR